MAVDTVRVWDDLHEGLRRFVGRRVAPADVDDVVQRVFLRVHEGLPALRETDKLHAWIYQTTRRAIADHYRAPARRREVAAGDAFDVAADVSAPAAADDEPAARRELAACIRPLLSALNDADREALRLVEVEGVSQVEAARQLGVSTTAMKSRVQRARTRLRDVVEACCRVELDRRGGPVALTPRGEPPCGSCG